MKPSAFSTEGQDRLEALFSRAGRIAAEIGTLSADQQQQQQQQQHGEGESPWDEAVARWRPRKDSFTERLAVEKLAALDEEIVANRGQIQMVLSHAPAAAASDEPATRPPSPAAATPPYRPSSPVPGPQELGGPPVSSVSTQTAPGPDPSAPPVEAEEALRAKSAPAAAAAAQQPPPARRAGSVHFSKGEYEALLAREDILHGKLAQVRGDLATLADKERDMELVDVAAMQRDLRFYEQERVYLYARVFGCEAAAPGEDWRGPEPGRGRAADAAPKGTRDRAVSELEARVRALRKEFFAAKKQATDAARRLEAAKMDNYRLDAAVAYHERFSFLPPFLFSLATCNV
ncbi:hypothetical protein DIPPA_34214 [Diplonema papillatum]|nr:hypothetical protein DIPPA_34214 [Diplonema papillatum]